MYFKKFYLKYVKPKEKYKNCENLPLKYKPNYK